MFMDDPIKDKHNLTEQDVRHGFHAGWEATHEDALENADALRAHMAHLGMQTRPDQWSVYSDPRKQQVLKEKFGLGGDPPTSVAAAQEMVHNTLHHIPTVWHGHSQGAQQVSHATGLAARVLASRPERVARAREIATDLSENDPDAYLARMKGLNIDANGVRTIHRLGQSKPDIDKLTPDEVNAEVAKALAAEKAEKKLNKYNMYSYTGGAAYPPALADNAAFAHNSGDPVSKAAPSLGLGGDSWRDGPNREMHTLNADEWRLPTPLKKYHSYTENYAAQDALMTQRRLKAAGFRPQMEEVPFEYDRQHPEPRAEALPPLPLGTRGAFAGEPLPGFAPREVPPPLTEALPDDVRGAL